MVPKSEEQEDHIAPILAVPKNDITVCDLTGTGVQDTAIARHTYDIANSNI